MTKTVIDFETYYDGEVSVSELGNRNYTKKADAYIAAVTIGNEVLCGTIAEVGPILEQLAKDPKVEFWAANSEFDRGFFEKHVGKAVNPWKCLLDLGSYHQMPRDLAGLAKTVLHVDLNKNVRDMMKGIHYEDLSDEAKLKVQNYCSEDVQVSAEILAQLGPMDPMEEAVSLHTRMTNARGVYIDTDLVEEDKTRLEQAHFDSLKAIPWHEDAAPLSYRQLALYCSKQGIPCPKKTNKKDEECMDLMSEHPKLNEVLTNMRRVRQFNMMIKKLETMMLRVDTDTNVMPLSLVYCGAPHTRRWSSQGFNLQNLDKQPVPMPNGETVWTRNWLHARPGKKFLILDFSQVEPRCLNWLVGNKPLLEAMKQGYSYYEAYASAARNWRGAPGSLKAEFGKQKYTLLKNECLGLGYGMGWEKFIAYALQNGAVVEPEVAKKTVEMFRKGNPLVTAFWKQWDNELRKHIQSKEKSLEIELPAGGLLRYFHMCFSSKGAVGFVVKGDHSHLSKSYLWGGVVTENLCQRMSRDLIASKVPVLERSGLPCLFHSHDEVILEVDEGTEKSMVDAKESAIRIMCQAPEWAEGLPLQVEGDYADSYCK